jgi:hypothetical protein
MARVCHSGQCGADRERDLLPVRGAGDSTSHTTLKINFSLEDHFIAQPTSWSTPLTSAFVGNHPNRRTQSKKI